jgi:hypothetical protein
MRSFEYALTLASAFTPPVPAGEADGDQAGLHRHAHHSGQRDVQVDVFGPRLVKSQEANPRRLAAVKNGS